MEIDWQPNTIDIRWYDNNTQITPSNSAANTCVYDDDLYLPSAPSRTGYTFKGWTVREQYDFSTIPINEDGIERWAIGISNNKKYCWYDDAGANARGVNCSSDIAYTELQTQEWKVRFNHGYLYGMSGCSTQSSGSTSVPTINEGQYCWCKATGYKINNTNTVKSPSQTLSWVYKDSYSSYEQCLSTCAGGCSYYSINYNWFRDALFTPANN